MTTTAQLRHLLAFELVFFFKRPLIYVVLAAFLGIGLFGGSSFSAFSSENTFRNSPFVITYILGYLSLFCIILTTVTGAQVIFRESEHHFSLVLYATPLRKSSFFISRFLAIACVSALSLLLLVTGFMAGQHMSRFAANEFGPFHWWYYLHPFLLLMLPNTIFCTALVCATGFLTKNKLAVYVSGLFVFIGYQVTLIFSGSPLIAGGMPPTEQSMQMAAMLDPFGLSAFLQQTLEWSAMQRNTKLVSLGGTMLLNRMLYAAASALLVFVGNYFFQLTIDEKPKKKKAEMQDSKAITAYYAIIPHPFNLLYQLESVYSLLKINLTFVRRSIPFLLILISTMFFIAMEMYGEIEQGIRIPLRYATSGLMVNTILDNFPTLCSLIILFYSNELLWRSRASRFHLIENTTPVSKASQLFAKWLTTGFIILLLLTSVVATGIVFQLIYQYGFIEIYTYAKLGYVVGLPLLINAGIVLAIQQIFSNRYVALVIATVFTLLTTTGIGTALHIKHPLARIGNAFGGAYSDMSGFGPVMDAFGWRMLYGIAVALLLLLLVSKLWHTNPKSWKPAVYASVTLLFALAFCSGMYINRHLDLPDADARLNWQAGYEQKYGRYRSLPQPVVTAIQTSIDLYPERNRYNVTATYKLVNKTQSPISRVLFYVTGEVSLKTLTINQQTAHTIDHENGHYWFYLPRPLQPNDSLKAHIEFGYAMNPFGKPAGFNAIVKNGAFMRISNYYPRLGYQPANEITEEAARKKRKLGRTMPLKKPTDPKEPTAEWLTLDMQVSTTANQTAIGTGELIKSWRKNNRNYFHYKTDVPLRFRFGVSSAAYAVKKTEHRGITIAVYYHPTHHENVNSLIANARHTLDYCEANFGKYPFRTIRFAEVSAFTGGFAATAYPATVFMTENMVFHAHVQGAESGDLINGLAGHELSHEWWGTNSFLPGDHEGAALLTETLAMYTELMLIKKMYGLKRALANVQMYRNMYLSERGYSNEKPLYRASPDAVHLNYYKGLVSMYQLTELIGEEKVNMALRKLYQQYAGSGKTVVSTDFLNELYQVTDPAMHQVIDDLFKKIIIYKPVAQSIVIRKAGNRYETVFDVEVHKYEEDGQGRQKPVDFTGVIEIGFQWPNGREQLMAFHVNHNKAHISVRHPQKPISLVLDPQEKLMKSGEATVYALR